MDVTARNPASAPPPAAPAKPSPSPPSTIVRLPLHPGLSGGRITSGHVQWVTELRAARGRWTSELNGPWTQAENDYFEFTYELFHAGLLKGVEVGLPIRYFMSELLGCFVNRIDQKLFDDKRIRNLTCPRLPQREVGEVERRALTNKLFRLENAFMSRERGPCHSRVRYNLQEDENRFMRYAGSRPSYHDPINPPGHPSFIPARPAATASAQLAAALQSRYDSYAIHGATYGSDRPQVQIPPRISPPQSSERSGPAPAGIVNLPPPIDSQPSSVAAAAPPPSPALPKDTVQQRNNSSIGPPQSQTNGRRDVGASPGTPATGANGNATSNPSSDISPAVIGSSSAAVAQATSVSGTGREGQVAHSRATAAPPQQQQPVPSGSSTTTEKIREQKAPQPTREVLEPTKSFVDASGRRHPYVPGKLLEQQSGQATTHLACGGTARWKAEATRQGGRPLGQALLGVSIDRTMQDELPLDPKRLKIDGRKSSTPPPFVASSTSAANGGPAYDNAVPETSDDLAAMEYLKWELHGKFMAFPGEHYHKLLDNLASEIYHNRYAVEHGVDILQGVVRDAAPKALEKCAATLKRMNLPPKMTL